MNAMMASAVSSLPFFIRPQMLEWSRPVIIRVSMFDTVDGGIHDGNDV